ncbi:MAG: fumarylacetoacetate hydrolase family protein [Pseudomonadota bacterium]
MSAYAIAPPPRPSVAIEGSAERFPVRRIFCVGRNYAAHAREMGQDPDREAPFFFTKPADAVVDSGSAVPYPPLTENLHHEIELVVAIGIGGARITEEAALGHVWGYAVGVDLTRRDLQLAAREKGRPWDWGKAFDFSAPCAPIRPAAAAAHPSSGRIWLTVDGESRQDADISELIWSVPEVISILSHSITLAPGDLIYTGTPAGVGPVRPGQRVEGGIDGIGVIAFTITEREG